MTSSASVAYIPAPTVIGKLIRELAAQTRDVDATAPLTDASLSAIEVAVLNWGTRATELDERYRSEMRRLWTRDDDPPTQLLARPATWDTAVPSGGSADDQIHRLATIDPTVVFSVVEYLSTIIPMAIEFEERARSGRMGAGMDAEIYAPDVTDYIEERMRMERIDAVLVNRALESAADSEIKANCPDRCRRCGKRDVFFTSVQTRCADEATTLMYRCLSCNAAWRES